MNINSERHIEEVIEAGNQIGQYNYNLPAATKNLSCHVTCSEPIKMTETNNHNLTEILSSSDSDSETLTPTDSEVTVVRVKTLRNNNTKTSHLDLVGDGRHLVESLSLINLVTLVVAKPNEIEVFVPLSSWEPNFNRSKLDDAIPASEDKLIKTRKNKGFPESLGMRLKNFVRRRFLELSGRT